MLFCAGSLRFVLFVWHGFLSGFLHFDMLSPSPRTSTSANDEEDDLSKADGEGEAEAETEAAPPLRRPETPAALNAGDASDTAGETESEAEVSCCCCHRSSGEQAAF